MDRVTRTCPAFENMPQSRQVVKQGQPCEESVNLASLIRLDTRARGFAESRYSGGLNDYP